MDNIERFKKYLNAKGYQNCRTRDFSEDMHGVRCEIELDRRTVDALIGEGRRDFTQIFMVSHGPGLLSWYNVRLGVADFQNEAITAGLFPAGSAEVVNA